MLSTILIWLAYIVLFVYLAKKGRGYDVTTSGTVGFAVQAFAYVATYVSAVALIGFSGLAFHYGVQISLVGVGVAAFGTYFVYTVFAWDTKQMQDKLKARTPAHLIALSHDCPKLRAFLGIIFALFLSVYASGVLKGAAITLQSMIPVSFETLTWGLAIFVGVLVCIGGLRGVLYTEAMQGAVMLIGICLLGYAVFSQVGGPIEGWNALSQLEPTAAANNGFTSLSFGSQGMFVLSLVVVMSFATPVQPQVIQRHFALSNKRDVQRTAIIASVIIFILVAGMFYIAALSRLILPTDTAGDHVVSLLTATLLPSLGQQIFSITIISASLSTTTALYHIAATSFSEDLTGKKTNKMGWYIGISLAVIISAMAACLEGQIIALLCTTSWSVIGSTAMVAYIASVKFGINNANAAWYSSVAGFVGCVGWYLVVYPSTSIVDVVLVSRSIADIPPFLIGLACSLPVFVLVHKLTTVKEKELAM